MTKRLIYAVSASPALGYAVQELEMRGFSLACAPCPQVTHLLLPVPCRMNSEELSAILAPLPQNITVLGGFLHRPELEGYTCLDLLKDERYQAKNAMITSYCAITLAAAKLPITWDGCPVLILGWGRIGKTLGSLLKRLGAHVSVAARKETDLAMISALGCDGRDISQLDYILQRYRVIFNTVPHPVLTRAKTELCREDCLMVELASSPGIDAPNVMDGRSLPGKLAPESAGKLIAQTLIRLCAREEETT